MRRPVLLTILCVVFAYLGLNALLQVAKVGLRQSDAPALLVVFQSAIGLTGCATAWGAWHRTGWSAIAAVSYGVVTAAMLATLQACSACPARRVPGCSSPR